LTDFSRAHAPDLTAPAGEPRRLAPNALLLACVILSLLMCGALLVYGSGRGLDLTDEIFYLIWTRDPNAYALVYQPFGYLLHPLFRLVGGNLQIYRLTGFAIAVAAGAFLGGSLASERPNRIPLALYGAVAALTIFYPWIITPSYNSAANVGAMLAIAGFVNAGARPTGRRIAGALATGGGLCIAAFSKPPLFAIAVAGILAAVFLRRRSGGALPLLAGLAIAATLISLVLAPTELAALVIRILSSQHALALPNAPLGLPAKVAHDWALVPIPLTGAAVAAAFGLGFRRSFGSEWAGYAAVALSAFYLGSVAPDAIDGDLPDFLGLALVIGIAGYAAAVRRRNSAQLPVAALLLLTPFAVALGTFNNQWFQLNFSMAFPFLALFVLASADVSRWRRYAAFTLCVAGPVAILSLAAFYPYSLPDSIFEQQTRIDPPLVQGSIQVDEETASFVRSARGLASGALLIDLSGTGPGVGAILGARVPVLPWLNPATETWPNVVWSRLSTEQRESAWFVGPVWPSFDRSAPALWFAAHKGSYCAQSLPPMTFWDHERALQVWRPCRGSARA